MKLFNIFILFFSIFAITGCSDEAYTSINHHQSFVASVNILEPSITFYEPTGKEIANWKLEKAFTGAELIQKDRILVYGHQLNEAEIYELSSGKKLKTIETGIGTTNAYYDENEKMFFLTNSEKNSVTSFDHNGNKLAELKLRNYPMSMSSYNGKLYVVNYNDTKLSVIDLKQFQLEAEWDIEKSSNGLMIVPEKNAIWIGSHGEGSNPNQTIDVIDLHTGQLQKEIKVSLMPIDFSRGKEEIYVVNHGSNELYAVNLNGESLWNIEVGANPFAVSTIKDHIVVAGYDDHTIYFIKDGKIVKSVETDKGPFQLLVREVE